MGGKLELHPLAALFAVLVGGEIGGVVGVYLSIPIMATLRIFWRRYQRYSEQQKTKADDKTDNGHARRVNELSESDKSAVANNPSCFAHGFRNAEPSTLPGPDSCTNATTRRFLGSTGEFSFTSTSLLKVDPFFRAPIFLEIHHNRRVNQVPPAVFSAQNLRLCVIESDGNVHIRIACRGAAISVDMHSNTTRPNTHRIDIHRNLRRGRRFLKNLAHLICIAQLRLAGSIHDDLRRVGTVFVQDPLIVALALGQRMGGIWILPTIVIPIVHVFAEHDELLRKRLRCVNRAQPRIGRRTARTAFGGEELNENWTAMRILERTSARLHTPIAATVREISSVLIMFGVVLPDRLAAAHLASEYRRSAAQFDVSVNVATGCPSGHGPSAVTVTCPVPFGNVSVAVALPDESVSHNSAGERAPGRREQNARALRSRARRSNVQRCGQRQRRASLTVSRVFVSVAAGFPTTIHPPCVCCVPVLSVPVTA